MYYGVLIVQKYLIDISFVIFFFIIGNEHKHVRLVKGVSDYSAILFIYQYSFFL